MMKKLAITATTLLFLLLLPAVFAADAAITLSDPVFANGEVSVVIQAANLVDFDTASFTIDYSPNALTLVSLVAGEALPDGSTASVNTANGLAFVNAQGYKGVTQTGTTPGTFATIKFTPKTGNSDIQLKDILLGSKDAMKIRSAEISNKVIYSSGTAPTAPVCGNGVPESPEVCDDGGSNGVAGHCNSQCTGRVPSVSGGTPVCGNGVKETGEECDGTAHCSDDCKKLTYCGDGTVQKPNGEGITETCDSLQLSNTIAGRCKIDCSGTVAATGGTITNDDDDEPYVPSGSASPSPVPGAGTTGDGAGTAGLGSAQGTPGAAPAKGITTLTDTNKNATVSASAMQKVFSTLKKPYVWIPAASVLAGLVIGMGGFFGYKYLKGRKEEPELALQMPGGISAVPAVQTPEKPAALAPLSPLPAITPAQQPVARPAPVSMPAIPSVQPKPADPVLDYVASCRKQGFSDDQIKAELRKQGWSEQDIVQKIAIAKGAAA